MAKSNSTAVESAVESAVVESEVLETETVEAPEVEVVETEAPEVVIDLTDFRAATATALQNADPSTGTVTEADEAAVRTAYQALPGVKGKNAAKSHLTELLNGAIDELNVVLAKAVQILLEKSAVAGKSTPTKAAVDPTEGFVAHLATLTLALYLASNTAPEGVDLEAAKAKATEQANESFAAAVEVSQGEGDLATGSPLINAAVKLATTKVRGGRRVSGSPQKSIARHLEEFFADKPVGFAAKVSEIRSFKSAEYGDEKPSSGAISNRIKPKSGNASTVEGVTGEERDGILWAVKTA